MGDYHEESHGKLMCGRVCNGENESSLAYSQDPPRRTVRLMQWTIERAERKACFIVVSLFLRDSVGQCCDER